MPLMQIVEPDAVTTADGAHVGVVQETAAAKVKTTAEEPAVTADLGAVLIGYTLLAAGAVVGIVLWEIRDPGTFAPGAGVSIFAPLYILAQGIERFIEPWSSFLGSAKAPDTNAKKKKSEAQGEVSLAIAKGEATNAAKWQKVVDQVRRNTAVIAWGVASFLGMALCGLFGILLMRLVGLKGVPAEVDIVLTGLAIGSGTKPLHDLISNVQKAKEQKEDPPEKKAA